VLEISEMDFRTRAGARLEGAGVVPDEQVAPTRRDFSTGRDRALQRAFELLKRAHRR
jgi:C-terminal processing protease CtpA/Prc